MRVLVAVGSKYGSTREIGDVVATTLRAQGFDVDLSDACDVQGVHFADAVIIGSAVYGSLWRRDASTLVRQEAEELRRRDVWTFSVGVAVVAVDPRSQDEGDELSELIGAREHKHFAGALDVAKLNVGEKALIRTLNPPLGDHRDLDEVRAWAGAIGAELMDHALD